MRLRHAAAAAAVLAAAMLATTSAEANWTATGRFLYVDRAYNQTGFTGSQPSLPIRYADVHIVDSKNKVLGSGATDGNGNFSIFVVDGSTRTVYARVTTRSLQTPSMNIDVQNSDTGKITYYSVRGADVRNHAPNVNVNFGTITALKGQGGEAFNIYDQLVRGQDYIAALTGSRSALDLTAVWAIARGKTDSDYQQFIRYIQLRDSAGYDDTAILHEMAHYFIFEFSATDSPNGAHTFSDCNEDIRLAYEEGYATYWGNSALRHAGIPGCHIYMRSNGGPAGPGSLVRYADLETDTQYLCKGATSEMQVISALWDINDSTGTPDGSPGVDDSHDAIGLSDGAVWQVQRDYIPTAANKAMEDFWDGWHFVGNGFHQALTDIFAAAVIEYWEDPDEVNNSPGTATPLSVGAPARSATFFYDPDGDGVGESDTDHFVFSATGGVPYTLQTTGLLSDGNTLLELLDISGLTLLASNDNRAPGNDSSLITWTAPETATYLIRVRHATDYGIYGSYRISVTSP